MSDKVQRGPLSELDIEDLYELAAAVQECLEKSKTMRHYCLGSDASTENMLAEYDASRARLDAAMSKRGATQTNQPPSETL